MIHSKLEIRYLIHSLNELEKLKRLLFDDDQYYLFEHIPKPYLIDGEMAKKFDATGGSASRLVTETNIVTPKSQKKQLDFSPTKKGQGVDRGFRNKAQTLLSNNFFWTKHNSDPSKIQQLSKALDNIKKKQ